ncbi:RHOMBOID-like protein 3 [Carex rostrata]
MASDGTAKTRGSAPYYYEGGSSMVEEERRWKPWLVPLILIASVVVFIVEMLINNCPKHPSLYGNCVVRALHRFSFQPLRENPLFGPSSSTLVKVGGLVWDKVVNQHQGWRLITSIWLHAGLIHLLVNMLSLLFVGIRLEQQFGFVRVGLIYLVSGFGGNVLSALFLRNGVSVGASGALFGLLGSMLSELITNWSIYSNRAAAILTLGFIIVLNLAVGTLPHVDNFAHIGGFITGLLLGFVLLPRPQFGWMHRHDLPQSSQPKSKYKPYQYVLWVISLLMLLAGFTVILVMLFKGKNGNDHCHWCHYLNCIPTSKWNCDSN